MSGEIRKADPNYRRKVKLAAVMGLVLLAALYAVGREVLPSVERWIVAVPGQEAERARLVLVPAAVLAALPLLFFAAYFMRLAGRVFESGCFPPPGVRVLRDVEVLKGKAAARRGRLLRLFAVLLITAGVVLVAAVWLIISRL